MSDEEKKIIKEAVKEALQEEIKPFYIEREQHYQDHQFITSLRKWCEDTKSTIWRTILRVVVMALLGLMVMGFILWGYKNIKI